jgi:hypothetical protein
VAIARVPEPLAAAVGLTAFRELPDGRGRQYTESWFSGDPWRGCEHFIRTCGALGFLRMNGSERVYALLDVLDEEGEVLATYDIPHAQAFKFIYRKLHLRVAPAVGVQRPAEHLSG